jgi:hypothetical protein
MPRYTAVLDACALVPIALADTLLRVAEKGLYRPLWTDRILSEAQAAIEEVHPGIDPGKRFASMREAFNDSLTTGWEDLEGGLWRRTGGVSRASCPIFTWAGAVHAEDVRRAGVLRGPGAVAARYGIDVRQEHEVVEVNPAAKEMVLVNRQGGGEEKSVLPYDIAHLVPPQSAPAWIKAGPLADPANPGGTCRSTRQRCATPATATCSASAMPAPRRSPRPARRSGSRRPSW